jgi:NitT/TauT family transport system substrate-binding protein
VLTKLNRVKPLDINAWVNESYVKQAFAELKLDYEAQKQTLVNYDITGTDTVCKVAITRPRDAGEVWVEGASSPTPHASALCTLAAVNAAQAIGKKVNVAYVYDKALGIKVFADQAFYSVNASNPMKPVVVPFLLKKDAESHAAANGGTLAGYADVLALAKDAAP